jgi:hypothetical protein
MRAIFSSDLQPGNRLRPPLSSLPSVPKRCRLWDGGADALLKSYYEPALLVGARGMREALRARLVSALQAARVWRR